jgi:hypothetical protein
MNARFLRKVRLGLTATALALCGALVVSGNTGCAGDSNNGGGNGNNTGTGTGGSGSGNGGSGGGNTSGGSCTAGANDACFAAGKGSGIITGYGFVALGVHDDLSKPVCDNSANGGAKDEKITNTKACNGSTVWPTDTGLCITGDVPAVGNKSDGTFDYTGYWGVEVAANTSEGSTIDISKYTKVTFTYDDSGVSPSPSAGGFVRAEIHVKGHTPADESYCATIGSGKSTTLSTFNTACWDGSGKNLTADDMKQIDNIGVQLSSSDKGIDFKITNFCWTGISFQ